jgi:putative SOS response-associated peptidase YedK
MCGRYTLVNDVGELRTRLNLRGPEHPFLPRFNIAPTQTASVVIRDEGETILAPMRWGLVPFWAKEESIGYKMINARSETLAEKPAFKRLLARRRCLIPADSFYEWKKGSGAGKKQPWRFLLKSRASFAFGGLWDRWNKPDGSSLESFTIITTAANDLVKTCHERMPLILPDSAYETWLDLETSQIERVQPLLQPYPADQMTAYPVSTVVNSSKVDDPACIEPVEDPGSEPGKPTPDLFSAGSDQP